MRILAALPMKLIPLVWAMLWRRRTRTALTFASIAIAFMLFGLLQAFHTLFAASARFASADVLLTGHRYGFIQTLPYAYRRQIEAMDGVRSVTPAVVFPFVYRDAGTQPSLAVDPMTVFEDPRFLTSPEHLKAFQETRTGMIAGRELAQKHGWKVGDRIPLKSSWHQRSDGGEYWEFDLVGLFEFNADILGEGVSAMRAFVRYDYVDEARTKPGQVNLYFVRLTDPARAPSVSRAIDELFQNSSHSTKTQSEAEQQRSQLAQIGDIGLIIGAILAAVFFTLVVVAGNTMMRAFRERIPDLAVLKTLGFTDGTVARLVAIESLLLCLTAGLTGLLAAWLVLKPIAKAAAAFLPLLRLEPETLAAGVALAAALGATSAAIPAWQSARLTVTAGLARR